MGTFSWRTVKHSSSRLVASTVLTQPVKHTSSCKKFLSSSSSSSPLLTTCTSLVEPVNLTCSYLRLLRAKQLSTMSTSGALTGDVIEGFRTSFESDPKNRLSQNVVTKHDPF